MADPVLVVQRTGCGDYKTMVAQLPRKELVAVCAAVMRSMLESGVDLDTAADLARNAEIVNAEYDVPTPFVITGGRG